MATRAWCERRPLRRQDGKLRLRKSQTSGNWPAFAEVRDWYLNLSDCFRSFIVCLCFFLFSIVIETKWSSKQKQQNCWSSKRDKREANTYVPYSIRLANRKDIFSDHLPSRQCARNYRHARDIAFHIQVHSSWRRTSRGTRIRSPSMMTGSCTASN